MTQAIPEGHEGLIPHLVCSPCAEAIEFYKKAFGAEEVMCAEQPGSGKIMHASMRIDDHILFLVDDFPEFCEGKEPDKQLHRQSKEQSR